MIWSAAFRPRTGAVGGKLLPILDGYHVKEKKLLSEMAAESETD